MFFNNKFEYIYQLYVCFFMFMDCFSIFMLEINYKNKKHIILIYFEAKNIFLSQ